MVDNGPVLRFADWADLVCGPFRTADTDALQDRWRKGWLPYQVTAEFHRKKMFHRKRRDETPPWHAWQSERQPRKERRRAMSRLDMQYRIAKAILAELELLRRHRMEPADLKWISDLERSCRATLDKKALALRARKEARTAPGTAGDLFAREA